MSRQIIDLIQFAKTSIEGEEVQPHQARLRDKMLEPDRRGLVVAWGLGSGKTRGAIEAHKAIGGDADVVVPASLQENYRKEMKRWGGDPATTTIHSQQNIAGKGIVPRAKTLIVDEGHRARNAGTNLSKILRQSPAEKRIILTGTPIYNKPEDMAAMVNQAAGEDVIKEGAAFRSRYMKPGFFARMAGSKLSHQDELKKILNKYVDYHPGDPAQLPRVKESEVPVDMGARQSDLHRAGIGKIPLRIRAKMALGATSDSDINRLKPYLTGPRMVSNTSRALDPSGEEESPKLDRVMKDLGEHLANPKGKALLYSNYLDHGIEPLRKRLEASGVKHGVFTGRESIKDRNRAVSDYNEGRIRALLVSSSGGEGLDLKGTRMVQVLEPHFNSAKIRQVIGRSARMGSHTHLPDDERDVDVRHYLARPKRSWFPGRAKGVDDMLRKISKEKDETDDAITKLLSSLSSLIHFERVENPIFRKGVKSGVHRIGEGKEKMIRIRSIVSPQWGIDKGKVSKMARKKNLPPPVVSHLGHGVYVLKDGNHRVNAILRQGKRKILAKVQKL